MNIATTLRSEIVRIARRETRLQTASLKYASARHRKELASLKSQLAQIASALRRLSEANTARKLEPRAVDASAGRAGRFSAKGFAAHRSRLALSAAEMASLLNVSAQSVYHWARGKSRPHASQQAAISAVRGMGKRGAAYRLSVLQN
jgi:DNA-binding transcriptional regulator YiaG